MTEVNNCLKIFSDLKEILDNKKYNIASDYLKTLYNSSISEMKSGLIMTKAFKENEEIKESRSKLLELYAQAREAKIGPNYF